MSAKWIPVILVIVWMMAAGSYSADWKLVVTHSNDLWFQLDEIQKDNKPCYKELPPTTTTEASTTTTSTLEPSTPPSTTTSTESATTTISTTSTESTTTTIPTTSTESTTSTTTPAPASSDKSSNVDITSESEITETASENTPSPVPSDESSSVDITRESEITETASENAPSSEPEIEPNSKIFKRMANGFENELECYGGVARHLNQSKIERERGTGFLHLNAGGFLGGSIWFPILGSGAAVESIKQLNYDAIAIGYRDFEEGVPATVEYLKGLKNNSQTVLCANMDVSEEPSMKGLFEKSKIIEISGTKIGLVGFIGKDADTMSDTGKIKFEDEVTALNRELGEMFDKGATLIIALGSAGYDKAKTILDEITGIDLLISGGGKSVYQGNGLGPLGETPVDPYPLKKTLDKNYERLLVTTSRYGKYLGRLEMDIDSKGHILSHTAGDSKPILLDKSVTPDPTLQGFVDDWERTVLEESNRTLGYTKLPIISNSGACWYHECTAGSMIADAARWYLEHNYTATNQVWSKSVAACVWHGGAMASTNLLEAPGYITLGDILTMFPYHNVLTIATMKGSEIHQLMEASVEYYNESSYQGEFLHVSGMRVLYDLSKKGGERVLHIMIRDTSDPAGPLSPLNLNSVYRIGMPSFIARGGSRYAFMENIPHEDTEINDEIALEQFIGITTPLAYGNDGRIRFVTPPDPVSCPHVDVVGTVFLTIFLTLLFTGLIFAGYMYLYPKLRDRRGSLLSLVR